jgi:hypothetical protein
MPAHTIIDSRDLVDELRDLVGGDEDNFDAETVAALDEGDRERMTELRRVITELAENCEEEPRYGITMVPEHEFEDYAREFAEDIGATPDSNQWPLYCIDWARAADELRSDYTDIYFDGTSYLCR